MTSIAKIMLSCLLVLMTSLLHIAVAGHCFTDFGDEYGKCRLEGRFKADDLADCCSSANATGYSESTSWVVFPEYYIFNRKNAQTACQSCADYMSDGLQKKWCFTYRNSADGNCVQATSASESLPTSDEADCCQWQNASGYASKPNWKWSRSYGRWIAQCDACDKDDLVGCYDEMSIVKGKFVCTGAQARMSESSTECCGRKTAKAYDLLDRYGTRLRKCYPCPVRGNWSPWSVWSPCSTTCGQYGQRRRARTCNNPAAQFGGANCVGVTEQTKLCDNTNVTCPHETDGRQMSRDDDSDESNYYPAEWSDWSSLSSCSISCGNGSWTRQRVCLHLPSQVASCQGSTRETLPCHGPPCENGANSTTNYANGLATEMKWGEWSSCPVTCGIGIRKRYAPCANGPVSSNTSLEGPNESGECAEMSFCELQPCASSARHVSTPSVSDIALAWTVATFATLVLIISLVVLLCRTRLRDKIINWPVRKVNVVVEKRSPSSSLSSQERIKPRTPADLPQVPRIQATNCVLVAGQNPQTQPYCTMDILHKRFTHDPSAETLEELREKEKADQAQDDEGYEIPLHGSEVMSSELMIDDDDHHHHNRLYVQADKNLRNFNNQTSSPYYKNGTLAINHVYEQLEFGQPPGAKV